MNIQFVQRLEYIDRNNVDGALAIRERHVPVLLELIAGDPHRLRQSRFRSLATDYQSIAFFSYAIGRPLDFVKTSLRNAAEAYMVVFELRGTEAAFPAYTFRYDPAFEPGTPESTVEFACLSEPGTMDFSVTNSRNGYVATLEAWCGGDDDLGDRLASLIWDPPKASYVGPRSFCTPNHQRLAYALRAIVDRNAACVETELKRLKTRMSEIDIVYQSQMLRAINANDRSGFLAATIAFLTWHETAALSKKHRDSPEFFFCLTGLGLARLAIRRNLCKKSDFPKESVFFPIDLIA